MDWPEPHNGFGGPCFRSPHNRVHFSSNILWKFGNHLIRVYQWIFIHVQHHPCWRNTIFCSAYCKYLGRNHWIYSRVHSRNRDCPLMDRHEHHNCFSGPRFRSCHNRVHFSSNVLWKFRNHLIRVYKWILIHFQHHPNRWTYLLDSTYCHTHLGHNNWIYSRVHTRNRDCPLMDRHEHHNGFRGPRFRSSHNRVHFSSNVLWNFGNYLIRVY